MCVFFLDWNNFLEFPKWTVPALQGAAVGALTGEAGLQVEQPLK
jgi:hypothetical protein